MRKFTDEIKSLNPHVLNWKLFEKYNIYHENDIYHNHCAIMDSVYFIPGQLLDSLHGMDIKHLNPVHYDGDINELVNMSKVQLAFNRINKLYKTKILDYDIWINHIMTGIASGDIKMMIEENYGKEEFELRYPDFEWMSGYKTETTPYPYLYVMHNYCAHVYHKHLYEPENKTKYYVYNYVRGLGYCEFLEDIMWKDGITGKDIMKLYNENPTYFTETYSITGPLQDLAKVIYDKSDRLKLDNRHADAFYLLLLKRLIPEEIFNKIIVYIIDEGSHYDLTTYCYSTYRGMVLNPSRNCYGELYNVLDFYYVNDKNHIKSIPIAEYLKTTGIDKNELLVKTLDDKFEDIKLSLSYLLGEKSLWKLSKL